MRLQEQAAGSMRLVADMTARLESMALRQSELELRNPVGHLQPAWHLLTDARASTSWRAWPAAAKALQNVARALSEIP